MYTRRIRLLSFASLKTCLVALAACLRLPGKAIREPLRRTTRPPVSVNQIWPFGAAFSSALVPLVRKRLASM